MSEKFCVVCSDTRDVKKHYGVDCCYGCKAFFRRTINEKKTYTCANDSDCIVDKFSRNKCRSCRYDKCIVAGMSEIKLRDNNAKRTPDPPELEEAKYFPKLLAVEADTKHDRLQYPSLAFKTVPTTDAMRLVHFLTTMKETCLNTVDSKYSSSKLKRDDWIKIEKMMGRDVSMLDALQDPKHVCPRFKFNWAPLREAEVHDIAIMWYRYVVAVIDWVRGIPEFRMIPEQDQICLIKLNFINVSMLFLMHFLFDNPVHDPNIIPMGNGSYLSKSDKSSILGQLGHKSIEAYDSYLFKPGLDLKVDAAELSVLAVIRLFQYHENLSPKGQAISRDYLDKLYDTLFEYQENRFQDMPMLERSRRQSKLMMMISRMSQIWKMRASIHIMLITFSGMNIEGIPTELLFTDF